MMDELRKAKEALNTVFKKVLRYSCYSVDDRAGQHPGDVRSDITSVSFSSLRNETSALKPSLVEMDDEVNTGRLFHIRRKEAICMAVTETFL